MTKGLDKVFGLPSMEDILEETEVTEVESKEIAPHSDNKMMASVDEHGKSMDVIHDEMLKHAQDIAELAYDLDPARAPRMLEVGAMYYKGALDAKNSKRDAELKLITLMQNERKLKLEETKLKHEMGDIDTEKADVIMVEDRNALLKRLREEASNMGSDDTK